MLVLFLLGAAAGAVGLHAYTTYKDHQSSDLTLFKAALATIEQNYVHAKGIKPHQLGYSAVTGMVDSLGDYGHTRFLSPDDVKKETAFEQGQFSGIGVEVQSKGGHLIIVTSLPDSPAIEAGLRAGEIIMAVNSEDITGIPMTEARRKIAGPPGTQVALRVFDPATGVSRDLTLTRRQFAASSVSWAPVPGTKVAHVRITSFSKGTTNDLKKALTAVRAENMQALVLDLRDDPGGLLEEAMGVTSQFLESGDVLLEKDAHGTIEHLAVREGALASDIPMAVLVNEHSASAAEVVAGSLRDNNRAKTYGAVTFGTGTVLAQFNLPGGAAMLLATKEWLTPSGETIWMKGIHPDVPVAMMSTVTPLYPNLVRTMDAATFRGSGDIQLQTAVDALSPKAGA